MATVTQLRPDNLDILRLAKEREQLQRDPDRITNARAAGRRWALSASWKEIESAIGTSGATLTAEELMSHPVVYFLVGARDIYDDVLSVNR